MPGPKDYEKAISDLRKLPHLIPSAKDYSRAISEISKLIQTIPGEKSYDKRISTLEQAFLSNLYNTREPFKYFLPQRVWDDLRFPVGSVKGGGEFDTTLTAYKGGIVEAFSSGPNNESVQFIAQLPHG